MCPSGTELHACSGIECFGENCKHVDTVTVLNISRFRFVYAENASKQYTNAGMCFGKGLALDLAGPVKAERPVNGNVRVQHDVAGVAAATAICHF